MNIIIYKNRLFCSNKLFSWCRKRCRTHLLVQHDRRIDQHIGCFTFWHIVVLQHLMSCRPFRLGDQRTVWLQQIVGVRIFRVHRAFRAVRMSHKAWLRWF